MVTDADSNALERRIAEREAALKKLDLVERDIARDEITRLKAELDALQNPTAEPSPGVDDDLDEPEPSRLPASRRGGMPFVVSFLQEWRAGSASVCTFCRKPFAEDEVFLRGELYTTEAKRWTWISLHEACVLKHATLREYFTRASVEDFGAWFREQERRQGMTWNVKASAVKMLVVPRPPSENPVDLAGLQHEIERALAGMPDAVLLGIRTQASAEGYSAIIFFTEPEPPSRGMGFR